MTLFLKGPSGKVLPPLVEMVRERWRIPLQDEDDNQGGEKPDPDASSSDSTSDAEKDTEGQHYV